MKNKNLELLIKLNEKYGLNDEVVEIKKQLKKTVREKRELELELNKNVNKKAFFLKRWFNALLEFIKELFSKKDDVIKDLRKFYSQHYQHAFEQYQLGFLSERELNVFINNENDINFRIYSLQKMLDEKQKREQYLAVVKSDQLRLFDFLKLAKSDLLILEQELRDTQKLKMYDSESIKSKNNKINRLNGRIEKTKKEIDSINNAIEVAKQKQKRPVGRPKGSTKVTKT